MQIMSLSTLLADHNRAGARTMAGSCEHGNEHFDSLKAEKFLDYKYLNKDSLPRSYFVQN